MAQDTKANIQALNNAYLNDSVANKSIKPSQVNEIITDVTDSYVHKDEVSNSLTNTSTTDVLAANQGKVLNDKILAMEGSLIPQGNWDALNNIPDITSTNTIGFFWIVSVDGETNLGGITDWKVNDWAVYTSNGWAKVDNIDKVTSVNGITGDVELDADDIETFAGSGVSVLDELNNKADADDYLPLIGGTLTGVLNANGGIIVNQGQGYYSQLIHNQLVFNRGSANYINANSVGGYLRWRVNGSSTNVMTLGTNGQLSLTEQLNVEGGIVVNKSVVSGYSEIPSNGLIDLSLSNHYNFTISSDITFSFSNLPNKNMTFKLRVITGGVGNYTPTINTSNVDIKYISLDVNETVGEVTQWWCDYNYVDNTIYINSVSGFIAL